MKCIGIDIGSYSVKVFELNTSGKGLQLLNYSEEPLNPDPAADNELVILDALRNLANLNDPAGTKYIVCLPQSQVSTRYKTFPFKERNKILKSIPFELEDDIPFDQEDAVFDAKFLCFRGNTSEVIASACPKVNVARLIEKMNDAGIDPDIVSVEGLALSNLIEDFSIAPAQEEPLPDFDEDDEDGVEVELPTENGHIVLNMGHSKTTVIAFKNYRLIAAHTIEWGGRDLATTISRKYNIVYHEALKEIQSKAFVLTNNEGASQDQIAFSDTIAGSLNEMVRELGLIIIDLKAEFRVNFTHISLMGGSSQIKNLGAFLNQKLEIAANRFDFLERFPNSHVSSTPEFLASAGTALSLAIEGAKRPINPPTNLRKEEFEKQNEAMKFFFQKWGYAFQLLAVGVCAFFIYAFAKNYFATELSNETYSSLRKQAKSVGLSNRQSRPSGVRKYIRQKKNRVKDIETLSKVVNMNSALDVLNLVSRSVPGQSKVELNVKSFKLEKDQLSIRGTVTSADQLRLLESALRQVSANGKALNTGSGNSFSYRIRVDRNIPKGSR